MQRNLTPKMGVAFLVILLVLMSAISPLRCLAFSTLSSIEELSAVETRPTDASTPASGDADLRQQVRQMQQTILDLQNTVNSLKAMITKGAGPATAQKPAEPAVEPDIGNALIFGSSAPAEPLSPATAGAPAEAEEPDIGDALIFGIAPPPNSPTNTTVMRSALPAQSPFQSPFQAGSTYVPLGGLGGTPAYQSMNPDIVVSGDFLGHLASPGVADRNRFSMREAEFGFSSAIDPYARGTFIFSLPDGDSLELEEGYATLVALPFGLQANIGKFRSPIGKINNIHGHDLYQTDRPDVYTNFFGEDGLIESGVSVSKLLPTPWFSALDVVLANGDTQPLFGHGRFTKPLLVSHMKNFFQLSDTRSIELGLTGALGSRDSSELARYSGLGGLDLTYRWVAPNLNRALIWQSEVLGVQQEHPFVGDGSLFGAYSFMEYKFARRWSAGVRADYSQVPLLADASTVAFAPYINFFETEFGRFRVEYKHTVGNNVPGSDQLWLQYTTIQGLHPPHSF